MKDFYNEQNSIYCYPDSNVLKNKLDIRDSNKLFKLEKQIVLAKAYILRQDESSYELNKERFLYIHRFLFGDIYDFAGKYRKENVIKGQFRFAEFEFIDEQLDYLMSKLKKENYLKGLDKKNISIRLTYYMSELNVLHPFREGNGRTIREFIREIALQAGFILDLRESTPQEIFNATVKSVYDTQELENIVFNCLKEN